VEPLAPGAVSAERTLDLLYGSVVA
jgi:hypothetical protein